MPGILCLLSCIPAGAEDMSSNAYGSLVITWAGVIDNGEGDEPPHGPYGSLHVLVYEADMQDPADRQQYPDPLSHVYLSGPTSAGGSKQEWIDGDEEAFQDLEVFRWRKPDDAVTLLIYESDPSTVKFNFLGSTFKVEAERKHDRLFFSRISRMDTLSSPVTLSSGNVRLATGDAIQNLQKRDSAKGWIQRSLNGIAFNDTPGRDGLLQGGLPAMLVTLATATDTRAITKNYR